MVCIRGNHDPIGLTGVVESGNNDDPDGKYGVFAIHEDDFMWLQGVGTSNGNSNIKDDEDQVKATAANLKAYLDEKIENEFDKQILIVSHLPLHFSNRAGSGDGQYGKYIYDELDSAAKKGLNIYFLFGHNHSSGYDDYLGAASIYLKPGDEILIPTGRWSYSAESLAFTYLNAGYVGYYSTGNKVDKSKSMVVYEIYDNRAEISRYSTSGLINLKSAGVSSTTDYDADTTVYTSPMISKLMQFHQKGWLNNNRSIDAEDLIILKQHLLGINELDAKYLITLI